MGRSNVEALWLPYRMPLILHIGDAWIRGTSSMYTTGQSQTPLPYNHCQSDSARIN
jgi:hypothetical protein